MCQVFQRYWIQSILLKTQVLLPLTCIPLNSLFLLCEGNCGILTHIVAIRLHNLIFLVGTACIWNYLVRTINNYTTYWEFYLYIPSERSTWEFISHFTQHCSYNQNAEDAVYPVQHIVLVSCHFSCYRVQLT